MDDIAKAAAPVGTARTAAKLNVFISYSRQDIAFVDGLQAALGANGIEAFVDRDHIEKGEEWWARITQLITDADTIVFVLSPGSVDSTICKDEVAFAEKLNKRFVPIVARDLEGRDVPAALSRLNYVFFIPNATVGASGDFDAAVSDLVRALETDIPWIREHTRLGGLAERWEARKRPGDLLLRGAELNAAETWLTTRPAKAPDPTDAHRALVTLSRQAATRRQRTLVGLSLAAVVVASVLTGTAFWQRGVAVENEQRAVAEKQRADTTRNEALLSESKNLADLSRQALERDNDPGTALLLALQALPDASSDDNVKRTRPFWKPAEIRLDAARRLLREKATLGGHSEAISVVAVSPDGSRIVTGSSDETAKIWDAATLVELGTLNGHVGSVRSVAVSADGSRIFTASHHTVHVWDGRTFVELAKLNGHTDTINEVAVSADGSRIFTASNDNTFKVWNATTFAELATLKGHGGSAWSVAVSADGSRIVTGSHISAQVWDGNTFANLATLKGHGAGVPSVAVSPDGGRIITGSNDKTAKIWDATTFAELATLQGHGGSVWSVTVSADGSRIFTGTSDTAKVWDAKTFVELNTFKRHLGEERMARKRIAVSPDASRIITGSSDGTIKIWDARTTAELITLSVNDGAVNSLAVSTDGSRIVVGSDSSAQVWDGRTFTKLAKLPGVGVRVSVASSADGSRIVGGSEFSGIMWDGKTFAELAERQPIDRFGRGEGLPHIAVSADGSRIFAGHGGTATVWDEKSFTKLGTLKGGHSGIVLSIAVSPDASRIITGSNDGTAKVWDATTFAELATLKGHYLQGYRHKVLSVAVSPDGSRIVTGSSDKTAKIWDATTFAELATLKGHDGSVWSVAVSADGSRIITGSEDGTAKVWDATTFAEMDPLNVHDGKVLSVAASADGSRIVTGSSSGRVKVWESFPSGQALVDDALKAAPRCLTSAQRERFHLEPAPPTWCVERRLWPYHTDDWQAWLPKRKAWLATREGPEPEFPKE